MAKVRDEDRARRTLYVTGFNSKKITKPLLKDLFTQGGPVVDITLFETHAYILFQDEESVPYCLALFNEVELHGEKLRLNPRFRTKDTYCYINYLAKVRSRLRDEYLMKTPPELPPKKYGDKLKPVHMNKSKTKSKNRKEEHGKSPTKKTKRGKRNKMNKSKQHNIKKTNKS